MRHCHSRKSRGHILLGGMVIARCSRAILVEGQSDSGASAPATSQSAAQSRSADPPSFNTTLLGGVSGGAPEGVPLRRRIRINRDAADGGVRGGVRSGVGGDHSALPGGVRDRILNGGGVSAAHSQQLASRHAGNSSTGTLGGDVETGDCGRIGIGTLGGDSRAQSSLATSSSTPAQ